MSKHNKVNPSQYTQAGRLSQDDAARERSAHAAGAKGGHGSEGKGSTGISNRESAEEEAEERERFPPRGEHPADTTRGVESRADGASGPDEKLQTSRKAGSRSSGQKGAESKYTDEAQPPSKKVDGAFGEERKR